MTPEKEVQNKILEELHNMRDEGLPIFFERRQAGGISYKKGMPDIYVVFNGIHIEIEVKRLGGHLSTMQEKWIHIFEQIGIKCIVADSFESFLTQFVDIVYKSI